MEAKDDFTKRDVAEMLFDVTSSLDHVFARDLLSFLSKNELSDLEIEAYEKLKNWEGEYLMTSVGPAIYNRSL